ncbi:MAG: type II secretion system protein GspD, partial [Candidatus Omnitrophica bacterium]|nr:type II secretion system protein GspD [Candidatus Omnitrophota bacterium]
MINIINKRNRWIGAIVLAVTLSLSLGGIVQAKTNISDELWEDELIDIKSSGGADVAKAAADSSEKPIMIDVLDLKAMDILDVLKLVSQKSGLNIVAGQDVRGKVTVFLKNVEVREVLRIIVAAYGWAYVEDGDIIRIMTDKEYETQYGYRFGRETETRIKQLAFARSADVLAVLNQMKSSSGKVITDENSGILILTDAPKVLDKMDKVIKRMDILIKTETFVLSYAKAANLSEKISEMLTPSVGTVKTDERSNRLVVTDTSAKVDKIRSLIAAFDQKNREVLIEAKILQIVLSNEHKLGVDWEAVVSDFHNLSLKSNFDILNETDKRGALSIGTLDDDQYTAFIDALDTVGETEILSSPRIAVINNQEAKILVGSTEPYVTSTTTTPSAGPTTTAESVSFIEVGVKLYVTPTIHEDDFITMKIRPEVSSVTSNVTTSNNNTIPVVETSEAETIISVKDRVTVVIGGLIKEETVKSTKKVPFLGSIPILGVAFRNESDLVRKTEIVLFLTPRIISGDVGDGAFKISDLP